MGMASLFFFFFVCVMCGGASNYWIPTPAAAGSYMKGHGCYSDAAYLVLNLRAS